MPLIRRHRRKIGKVPECVNLGKLDWKKWHKGKLISRPLTKEEKEKLAKDLLKIFNKHKIATGRSKIKFG